MILVGRTESLTDWEELQTSLFLSLKEIAEDP